MKCTITVSTNDGTVLELSLLNKDLVDRMISDLDEQLIQYNEGKGYNHGVLKQEKNVIVFTTTKKVKPTFEPLLDYTGEYEQVFQSKELPLVATCGCTGGKRRSNKRVRSRTLRSRRM